MKIKTVRKANGKVYRYRRDNMAPLPDLPETHPDFIRAYVEAEHYRKPTRTRAGRGTIADVAESYLRSKTFAALASGTQDVRRRILRHIQASPLGQKGMFADLEARHIRADLAKLDPVPANSRLKVWRALCNWAEGDGIVATGHNAAAGVKPRRVTTKPHRRWMPEHVEAFRQHWAVGTPQRLALEVFHWTGARPVDVRRLGAQMIDPHGYLCFEQQKTGGGVMIPWTVLPSWAEALRPDFDQLRACLALHDNLTFIVTEKGALRSQKGISQWFSAAASAAGLDNDLTAHGLRKARLSVLAEIGATPLNMMTWCGHESLEEVEAYIKEASRIRAMRGTEQDRNLGNRSGNSRKPKG